MDEVLPVTRARDGILNTISVECQRIVASDELCIVGHRSWDRSRGSQLPRRCANSTEELRGCGYAFQSHRLYSPDSFARSAPRLRLFTFPACQRSRVPYDDTIVTLDRVHQFARKRLFSLSRAGTLCLCIVKPIYIMLPSAVRQVLFIINVCVYAIQRVTMRAVYYTRETCERHETEPRLFGMDIDTSSLPRAYTTNRASWI